MRKLLFAALLFAVGAIPLSAQHLIVSGLGGKCLDVEGGAIRPGARLIGFECHGGANQKFRFTRDRLVTSNGYCVASRSRQQGAELVVASCDFSAGGNALQNFGPWSGNLIGHNTGYVIDLKGGSGYWGSNQPAILWSKHGAANQKWYRGAQYSASQLSQISGTVFIAGQVGMFTARGGQLITDNGAGVIGQNGANVIGQNGANIVANNGARLIAASPLR